LVREAYFFKTFWRCYLNNSGGEDLNEVVPTIERLSRGNIGSILSLSYEADLDADEVLGMGAKMTTKNVVKQLKEAIDVAAQQKGSFIAVKITSLVPPSVLQAYSSTFNKLKENAIKISNGSNELTITQFKDLSSTFPGLKDLDLEKLFAQHDLNGDGLLNLADLNAIFSMENSDNCKALLSNDSISAHEQNLTMEHIETAELLFEDINDLCEYSKLKMVRLLMDAEQTYFQPAIDSIILAMCRKHNAKIDEISNWKGPMIFNTYQMYLVDSLDRLKADVARAEQEGIMLGTKLVRGAYMVAERERAEKYGLRSPVHRDIEATHHSYHSGIKFIIEKIVQKIKKGVVSVPLSLFVASHNYSSMQDAADLMDQHSVPKSESLVQFGQLLGMRDGATGHLSSSGFQVHKIVPYGPVPIVLPYLHRRAQENSTMIKSMELDKAAILSEIKYRISRQ
jgi:proline dehydrogenase